ncbi:type IV pilus assembly protein FimV [Massilia polaris]|uniref:type IV pilus assembly protein FimV n=1 Tax=Massilia polaris TaxID=2728846 RepID=UPI00197FDDD0|nr:hypothetical protein [Massilia polaris]
MPRRCLAVLIRTAAFLALGGLLASAHAVELGEVAVRSHIGQPLVADIELTGFAADGGTVDARLAHPDVFQGANIGMHPVLPSVRMSVMRRDGRQFLHITSIAPVQTQYVHLFLDLGEGGRRNVRAASLPLTPDPRPAPPPPAPTPAAPVPIPLAAAAVPKPVAPAPKPAAAVVRAVAAACPTPRYSDEEILSCATRDYKNAMLSAQIVELEEKVKALQAALDVPAPAAPVALPAIKPAKAAPPPIRTAPRTKASPAPAKDAAFPWMWIGVALAALAAFAVGTIVVLKRRSRVMVVAPERPKSNLMGRLRDALHRDKRPGAPVEEAPEAVVS